MSRAAGIIPVNDVTAAAEQDRFISLVRAAVITAGSAAPG